MGSRYRYRSLMAASVGAIGLVAWMNACVGNDPAPTSPTDPDAASSSDVSSTLDFSFDPPAIDLAPGETATLHLKGSSELATVTLSLVVDPIPDAGVPASAVTLGASSVSLATGEATVSLTAAPGASQQSFRVVGTAGGVTREARGRVSGKPGELDISFGDRGGYMDVAPDGDCAAYDVAVLPDGRFVVAGTARSSTALVVARFSAEGELDPSFGQNGLVTFDQAIGPRMELMPDGSIAIAAVVLGSVRLFRVSPSGAPDPAWGGASGVATGLEGGSTLRAPIGRLGGMVLVGGGVSSTSAAVKRYLPDAGLDPTFSGGTSTFSIPPATGEQPRVEALAVEPNGTYWVVGRYSVPTAAIPDRSYVRRFRSDGLDDGVDVAGTYEGAATDLVIQDGKAVVGAFDHPGGAYSLHVFRVTNDLDPKFGTDGKSLVAGPPGGFPTRMLVDSASRIYVVNGAETPSFDVYRLTPSGARDDTFGNNGLASIPTGRAYGAAITGRQLLVVGVNDPIDARRMRIARFWL